jgi:hypothetical protein
MTLSWTVAERAAGGHFHSEGITQMLAPLIIDFLYICGSMLVFGWAYDTVHAFSSIGHRDTHLAAAATRSQLRNRWSSPDRTVFHA